MPVLSSDLRTSLERTIINARDVAESAVRAALNYLGLLEKEAPTGASLEERKTRAILREDLKRLGSFTWKDIPSSAKDDPRTMAALELLVAEGAYEHWHQMLFARFLAENSLLIHPKYQQPVTLHECKELAEHEGDRNAWAAAARYASKLLPGIFRPNDPLIEIRLAPEWLSRLETLLESIPQAVFTSDDGLGWIYQFWQSRRKEQVNKSGRKIGGADISPVTQLFTEHYMVEFLLHNTLGAWWAAHNPSSPLNTRFTYLRRLEDGTPAAGTFEGWPKTTKELKVLDPCCGSGHFLVATAELLAQMRSEEEGLSLSESHNAVLRDNLYGLELDPRCTQIAAFNLALQAWKTGGYRELPLPHVACSGIAVGGTREDWVALAGDSQNLKPALTELWEMFKKAPDLGSLIDPGKVAVAGDLIAAVDFDQVEKLLNLALEAEKATNDPAAVVFGEAAKGVARAANILRDKYHLVITNVPYLGRGKQGDVLREHIERTYPRGKADLATAFFERCIEFCQPFGASALVTPQAWWFQSSYVQFRNWAISQLTWCAAVPIGEEGWSSFGIRGPKAALTITLNTPPSRDASFFGIQTIDAVSLEEIASAVLSHPIILIEQSLLSTRPDTRIALEIPSQITDLSEYAKSYQGIKTGDDPRYKRNFWEINKFEKWERFQSTVKKTQTYSGLEWVVDWQKNGQDMSRLQGMGAWGRLGVAVSQMRDLPVALYIGDVYDSNVSPIVPKDPKFQAALWAYCSSNEYATAVRKVDRSLKATNASLVKVPFDPKHWTKVAQEKYLNGLPEPFSNDPTQWLFKGTVTDTTEVLLVAVARLLGYRWPEQVEDSLLEDSDGIVCLPAVSGELPAADRLRALLAQAYGGRWTATLEQTLLSTVGYAGKSLEEWLRDGFFAHHCRTFHNRPFIWHVWDGRKDGFSALLNYQKLDRAKLEKLIFTYLGTYITEQKTAAARDEQGADLRLVAAEELKKKLEAILQGEPPYDIFVRWKGLHQQPIGWEPDLNDGVRLNIRPWVTAGVLRAKFTVNWNKDRGTDPKPNASGTTERLNDRHLIRQQKEEAKKEAPSELQEQAKESNMEY